MKAAALAAAWLAGLALAGWGYAAAEPLALFLLAGLSVIVALALGLLRRRLPAGPLLFLGSPGPPLLLAMLLLAMGRYAAAPAAPVLLDRDKQEVTIRGQVVNDPESTATRVKFRLALAEIRRGPGSDWQPQDGQVLAFAPPPAELVRLPEREPPYIRYGDLLEIPGSLQRPQPFAGFDYPAYLENQGISAILWSHESRWQGPAELGSWPGFRARIYDLRRRLARRMDAALPPEPAALAQALLLGLRGQLTEEVVQNFRQTGTSHLLAISGIHFGILLALTLGLLRGLLGRRTPAPLLLTLAAVGLYVVLSGASPSVVRAALMGSVYLGALALGRPRATLLPALAFSAVLMTALEPRLMARISFQLSFAAMVGIALALPWQMAASRAIAAAFQHSSALWRIGGGWPLQGLVSGVIIGAAATVATFPLVAFHFKELPLLGLPATLLAAPLLPLALVSGLAAALAGLIHPLLGQAVGLAAALPLTALLQLVDGIPGWTITRDGGNGLGVLAWYALLIAALLVADRLTSGRGLAGRFRIPINREPLPPLLGFTDSGRPRSTGAYLGLAGAAVILAASVLYMGAGLFQRADGKLHIHFFDVGQGDSALIVTPQGRQVLIDGGPDTAGAARALATVMPAWDKRLDAVAVTHLDADHSRGLLHTLESYRVDTVLVGAKDAESSLYPQWRRTMERQGYEPVYLTAGQTLTLEEGVKLEILHPPAIPLRGPLWNANNNSLVMRLVYGDMRFLLAGDIAAAAENYLIRRDAPLQSQVLKVAHHGSKSSTTAAFLRAVNPQWAVISAGADNSYGHPHPTIMARLEKLMGSEAIYQTAQQGTIHFSTDGQRLWVETEK